MPKVKIENFYDMRERRIVASQEFDECQILGVKALKSADHPQWTHFVQFGNGATALVSAEQALKIEESKGN